jgi:hypothetical protein
MHVAPGRASSGCHCLAATVHVIVGCELDDAVYLHCGYIVGNWENYAFGMVICGLRQGGQHSILTWCMLGQYSSVRPLVLLYTHSSTSHHRFHGWSSQASPVVSTPVPCCPMPGALLLHVLDVCCVAVVVGVRQPACLAAHAGRSPGPQQPAPVPPTQCPPDHCWSWQAVPPGLHHPAPRLHHPRHRDLPST